MAKNFTVEQNQKDLKFYKFVIGFTFFVAIVIALAVAANQLGTAYTAEAFVTNKILNKAMPTEIYDDTEGSITYGMTFYREENKDFNENTDLPLTAFNYYYLNDDGEKVYLEDGIFYPAAYYNENEDEKADPVYVAFAFFERGLTDITALQAKAQKAITIAVIIFTILIITGLIYIWYRVWSKREDEKEEMKKMLAENAKKK